MQELIDQVTSGRVSSSTPSIDPAFARLRPPTIIVGMHRSGTSMVAGMLHILGVYMDPELCGEIPASGAVSDTARTNGYGEAVAFRLVNESVLSRANSSWMHLDAFLASRDNPRFAATAVKHMTAATHSILKCDYLDRCPDIAPAAWGWKDPRNSLTLAYWLQLFPRARILHVTRTPDAVINSLLRRDAANAATAASAPPPSAAARLKSAASDPRVIVRGLRRRLGFGTTATDAMTYEDYLRLAELHVSACRKFENHPAGYLEVSYEAILRDPIPHANMIADFSDTCAPLAQVLKAAAFVLVDGKSTLRK